MKKIIQLFLFGVICFQAKFLSAQDIHFSQFYVSPMHLNPARAGFFDGHYRLAGLYRNQWNTVTVPYQTVMASGDFSIKGGKYSRNIFGIGLMAYSDRAGDGNYRTNQVSAALAYHQSLDDSPVFIGYGMMATYSASSIDLSKLYFEDQMEGGPTADQAILSSNNYLDASAGLEVNLIPNKRSNFNFGAAVFHINEPVESFLDQSNTKINRKFSIHGGATLPINDQLSILPKAYFTAQAPFTECVYGAIGRLEFSGLNVNDYALYAGVLHRWNDAFILMTRVDMSRLAFTFSYDFNHSALATASSGQGGPELSIAYFGDLPSIKKSKRIYCPKL